MTTSSVGARVLRQRRSWCSLTETFVSSSCAFDMARPPGRPMGASRAVSGFTQIIYVVSYTPTLLALRVTLYSYEPFGL